MVNLNYIRIFCRTLVWLLTAQCISVRVSAFEIIEAESTSGDVVLLRAENDDNWSAFFGANRRFYQGNPGYLQGDEFNTLTVRKMSRNTFPFGMIEHPFNVHTLRISGFGIEEYNVDEVPHSSNLWILDLSHNALKRLPAYAFSSLRQLQELDLSLNEISELDPQVFERAPPEYEMNEYNHNNNNQYMYHIYYDTTTVQHPYTKNAKYVYEPFG